MSQEQQALDLLRSAQSLIGGARAIILSLDSPVDEYGCEPHAYKISRSAELCDGAESSLTDASDYLLDMLASPVVEP